MKFSQKGLVLTVGIITFLIAGGLVGVAWWYQKSQIKTNAMTNGDTTQQIIWKTFTYNRFGHHFSVDLPTPVVTIESDLYPFFPSGIYSQDTLLRFSEGPSGVKFYINQKNKPLKQWLLEEHNFSNFLDKDLESITFDGRQGYRLHLTSWASNPGEYIFVFFAIDNIVYEISIGNHTNFVANVKPYYESIIKSFKFVEPGASPSDVNTSDWQKFEDKDLAMSFKYPTDWEAKAQTTGDTGMRQITIYKKSESGLEDKLYISNDYDSYETFKKTFQTSQASLLSSGVKETTFAGLPADFAEASIGGNEIGRLLFTSQNEYKPFYILYDPTSTVQQEIIKSFNLLDTKSSLANSNIQKKYLFFAQKQDSKVTVQKMNIQDSSETTILTYNESRKVATTGNLWEGMPPSAALSHDGSKLAYASSNGLYLYTISSGKTEALITKTAETPNNSEVPPIWSDKELTNVYIIANPHWSANDQYISFSNGYYEGLNVKLFDLKQKKVITLLPLGMEHFGTSYQIDWSDSGESYVLSNGGGYQVSGLFIGESGKLGKPVDYSQYIITGSEYGYADFSPDGKKVVTIYSNNSGDTQNKISVLDLEKKSSQEIANVKDIQRPFFGADNSRVYYLDEPNKNQLIQYDFLTGAIDKRIELPTEFNQWEEMGVTPEGYVELLASVKENSGSVGSNTNRIYLLDTTSAKMIYTSQLLKGFTTFLGFTN